MRKQPTTLAAAIFLLVSATVYAQQSRAAFEVADIKAAAPSNPMPKKGRILPGGRLEVPGMTLRNLIMMAYEVQEHMIAGGPKWADSQQFDIVAKAPAEASMPALRLMMQTLLAEQFKLIIHREDKTMPAYVLTLGKRAPQFHEGSGGRQTCSWQSAEAGLRRRDCRNMTMAELASQLPGWGGIGIDLPVVDQTGLKGAYDFQLVVGVLSSGKGEGPGKDGASPMIESGPTIFAALDRIGLRLDSRKMAMPMVVIDHAESPTGN
jgi:uncharacterized protein (TIGR03435 family)